MAADASSNVIMCIIFMTARERSLFLTIHHNGMIITNIVYFVVDFFFQQFVQLIF